MPSFLPYIFGNQHFILTREKTIYWEEENCLVLSDLHLGKSGHFRKNGIPVPAASNTDDMHRFMAQVQYFKPGRVIIVGDLFHSAHNLEADFFLKWRKDIAKTEILLIKGNHDILGDDWYAQGDIVTHKDHWDIGGIRFSHGDKEPEPGWQGHLICGHTHPAVALKGAGRQSLRLPCFYFSEQKAILPAFGNFTGRFTLAPSKKDEVFVITGEEVIRMK